MTLTFKDVSEILKMIDESDVAELVIEIGDTKIAIRRQTDGAGASGPATVIEPAVEAEPAGTAGDSAAEPSAAPPPEPAAAPSREGMTEIKAPMVGTFYRRPGPQDPPFVEPGDRVAAGDPLCLIEVMKLFTTIEAPVDGRVVEIAAENEALVQIDQLLFVIDPG